MEADVTIWETIWSMVKAGLDVFYKFGMVVIAIVNIIFARKLHKQQIVKDEAKEKSDHKVMLLKTLVLDHNLKPFYDFFTNITSVTDQLKATNADSKTIEPQIQAKFKELNEGFIDLLQGIDDSLYKAVLDKSDETRDLIINNMETYKLNVEKLYKEYVLDLISNMKKETIRLLFEFK